MNSSSINLQVRGKRPPLADFDEFTTEAERVELPNLNGMQQIRFSDGMSLEVSPDGPSTGTVRNYPTDLLDSLDVRDDVVDYTRPIVSDRSVPGGLRHEHHDEPAHNPNRHLEAGGGIAPSSEPNVLITEDRVRSDLQFVLPKERYNSGFDGTPSRGSSFEYVSPYPDGWNALSNEERNERFAFWIQRGRIIVGSKTDPFAFWDLEGNSTVEEGWTPPDDPEVSAEGTPLLESPFPGPGGEDDPRFGGV